MRTHFSCLVCTAALILPLVGCGPAQPTNVMENADAEAFKDYERMLAEDGLMQDQESPDELKPE